MPPVVAAIAAVANAAVGVTLAITGSVTFAAAVGNAILSLSTLFGASGFWAAAKAWMTVASLASLFKDDSPPPFQDSGAAQEFRADPLAARRFLFGEYGTAGVPAFGGTYDRNEMLFYAVALSSGGPLESFERIEVAGEALSLTLENEPPSSNSFDYVVSAGKYAQHVRTSINLGAVVDQQALRPFNVDVGLPAWTADHKMSGVASAGWLLSYSSAVFTQGQPQPLWVMRGVRCYDPRLDSTYPGGSGSQRHTDRTTWTWTRNPALVALWWTMGIYENGKRIGGIGMPWHMIDVATYVTAANVCDVNGWTCSGIVSAIDSKFQILRELCAAMGGFPSPRAGKLAVFAGAARTSAMTLTDDLLAGSIRETQTRLHRNRFNCAAPYYSEPTAQWQPTPAEEVRVEDYVDQDGEDIARPIQIPFVTDPTQARQISALALAATRESKGLSATWKPVVRKVREGDVVTVTSAALGIDAQAYRVRARSLNPDGSVGLELEQETLAKYDWAMSLEGTAPSAPSAVRYDPAGAPAPESGVWSVAGGSIVASGATIPALVVTGEVETALAASIIVEYRPNGGDGIWRHYAETNPATTRVEVTGIATGNYDVAISYRMVGTAAVTPRREFTNVAVTATLISVQTTAGNVAGSQFPPMLMGMQGWELLFNDTGLDVRQTIEGVGGEQVVKWSTDGACSSGKFITGGQPFRGGSPVVPGQRYEYQAEVSAATAAVLYTAVWWYEADGTFISESGTGTSATPATLTQLGGFFTAPALSAIACLVVRMQTNGSDDPNVMVRRPLLRGALSAQNTLSPWTGYDLMGDLPINSASGNSASIVPPFPASGASSTTIAVVEAVVTWPNGFTLTTPSATLSGLTSGTIYSVFYDLELQAYLPLAGDVSDYMSSPARYLYLGFASTQTGGGGYASPPPPPAGAGGWGLAHQVD